VTFELPPLHKPADATAAMAAITQGLADGELTASEAAGLGQVVQSFVEALRATDIEDRITRLENLPPGA